MMSSDKDFVKIKKEKADFGYENALNKAESLPIPIKIKEEPVKKADIQEIPSLRSEDNESCVIHPKPIVKKQKRDVKQVTSYEGELKEIQVKIEDDDKLKIDKRCVTPPMPVVVKVQPLEQVDHDVLSFLDEISDDIDDIIPIEPNPVIISIDEEEDTSVQTDGKSKKRKSSPNHIVDKIKKSCIDVNGTKEVLGDCMQFPRKVFNYNHSSSPGILENNDKESQKPSARIKIKQEIEVNKPNFVAGIFSKNDNSPLDKIKAERPVSNEVKMDQVLKNCNKALKRLRIFKTDPFFSRFLYTPTKLVIPLTDIEKEYKSPLLRSDHVRYKFSSTNCKINYRDFNLISLSENTTRISNLLGLDIAVLNEWIDNFGKNRCKKIQSQTIDKQSGDHSTFYVSNSTQTMDLGCGECLKRSLHSKRNVAVLAKCKTRDTWTQTSQQSELPVLKMIPYLNANELLAVNDFAMLLRENNWHTADSSLRLNIRDKLLHYFQEGQKQCNVPGTLSFQPQGVDNTALLSKFITTNDLIRAPPPPIINPPYPSQNSALYPVTPTNSGFLPQPYTYAERTNDPRLNRNINASRY
ncbi:uncharacterized protein LOC129614682 [Condylostylus longicornis]|uniref:uncharacterized protein LOC129614682 n=1 Tax=Condylostylus longicornis TaxID=2530218 RepID=UPI00244DBFCF|nr:uncharacterized protein LOC129614682 [Condylostylus longicornis]